MNITKKILKELKQYEPRGMHEHQLPVVWDKAFGDLVSDIDGKLYIDFTSGIFVTNVGHGTVAEAIKKQADKLIHSYTFSHTSRLNLMKKLREITGFEKFFLLSAGTEATDCAVKLMRKKREAYCIVSLFGSMHGKSMCAEKLRGNDGDNEWAYSNDDSMDFYHLMDPFNGHFMDDMAVLLYKRAPKEIAGFMIESYRGWNAKFYDKKYIQDLMSFAKSHNIPVCFDEIQGGFGRTGKLFAYEHYDVRPDLICVGKGLGGGLPISAVFGPASMLDIPDDLSSTHSANPICCEAAISAIDSLMKNDLITSARVKGELLYRELLKLLVSTSVKEVNCKGLLASIIFKTSAQADKVVLEAMKRGLLLVRTGRESIKIGPPLTIRTSNMLRGINILKECVCGQSKRKRTT
jgi:4-aminobutyrate aminotransferase-like enzyme